jgi:hypothetical protein
MPLKKEEIQDRIKTHFKSMEVALNDMESEVQKDEADFSKPKVGLSLGKVMKNYEELCFLLNVYGDTPNF